MLEQWTGKLCLGYPSRWIADFNPARHHRHPSATLPAFPLRPPSVNLCRLSRFASDETKRDATRRDARHERESGNVEHVAARMKKAAICSHTSLTDDWSVAGANRLSDIGAHENGNGASAISIPVFSINYIVDYNICQIVYNVAIIIIINCNLYILIYSRVIKINLGHFTCINISYKRHENQFDRNIERHGSEMSPAKR